MAKSSGSGSSGLTPRSASTSALGRRPKGDRSAMHVRVPRVHRAVYESAAQREGLPLGDYIALTLARAHELDEPDYVHRNRDQAELPLGA